jgi:hypothetical protein
MYGAFGSLYAHCNLQSQQVALHDLNPVPLGATFGASQADHVNDMVSGTSAMSGRILVIAERVGSAC